MSKHETFIQWLKIALALVALVYFIYWGNRIVYLLDQMVTLAQLNNEIFNMLMPPKP